MKNRIKVVARSKQGEVLKGFVDRDELSHFNENKSIYIQLVSGGNSIGTYICQEQLDALFLVKSFEGEKPSLLFRTIYDIRRIIRENLSIISAAAVVVILSLAGLVVMW
ncbi:MAG: hypothetical protein COA36_16330 [Desulfotalea sp.]|nr:MAG: hypothetical protein COA36_16330 [Desulfotalea sp.]